MGVKLFNYRIIRIFEAMAKVYESNDNLWLKPKVIAGFILIVVFAVVSIVFTYRSFLELNLTSQNLDQPSEKLSVINAIVTDVFAAESDIRTYMLTDDEVYLNAYNKKQQLVKQRSDLLKKLTKNNPDQAQTVVRISSLIENKQLIVDELVAFQRSNISDIFYEEALSEVNSVGKSAQPAVAVVKSTSTITHKRDTSFSVEDTTVGVFGRIRRFFVGPDMVDSVLTQTDVETVFDTIHYGKTVSDSVLRRLERRINRIRVEQSEYFNNLSEKEFLLLESDRKIMEQIRAMIVKFEHQELSDAIIRNAEVQSLVEGIIIRVLVLGSVTLILMLLLLAMIFSDISRGNLYRAQLLEAKQYAENLLKTKEMFLANMSHEIRTPLSAVIGMTRQMAKSELPEKLQGQVDVLKSSSDHLLSVINDILDYSKLESGQMKFESNKFCPEKLINEVVLVFESKAQEKQLALFSNIDPQTPTELWGDIFRLRQILMNIIGNSLKFTEKGSIILSVSPAKITPEYVKLQITISDTGIGISEEHQSLIFEDFTQADSSVSRKYGGTGLGLTIVKKLVDMQGGELILNSKKDEGTTISIIIPYAVQGTESEDKVKQDFEIKPDTRILIIDDDDVNRLIVEEMAKSIGIDVDSIATPGLIEDMVKNNSYAAILTDIQMPGMSGYDIVKFVDEKKWNIPVVAITANSMIDSPEHFTSQGFSGYLIKPFDDDELFRVISPIVGVPTSNPKPVKPISKHKKKDKTAKINKINLDEIYRFTGGDKNAIRSILNSFLDNSYINLDAINEHIKNNQIAEASAVAHKMKSVYKQFKIYHIASLLEKIERLRPDKHKAAQVFVTELNRQIGPVLKEVQRRLESII